MASVHVRPLVPDDWPAVGRIYEEGLATGHASFETEVPAWEEWDARQLSVLRLVAELDGRIVGWLAVSPVSSRACYRGVVEHSVYVDGSARKRGVGRALLERLLAEAPANELWTVQTSIMAANEASLALHAAVGFRVVGRRERIAQRGGAWHDSILMELRLP